MSACHDILTLLPGITPKNAAHASPLVLAYMGDTVYDLYVRSLLIQKSDATAHGLHTQATQLVRACAQAAASVQILPHLTEQENAIFHRGRNAHMGTIARNASIAEYRAATGLEAVIGYLFLMGDDTRIRELMELALQDTLLAQA